MSTLNIPDLALEFLRRLNESDIRYLLIGGFATKYYGCRAEAADVDLLIDNSHENARKLYPIVVQELGYQPRFTVEELSLPRKRLSLSGIDILTSTDAFDFLSAYDRRKIFSENNVVVSIISKEDLISVKREAIKNDPDRRQREEIDIEHLQRINRAII